MTKSETLKQLAAASNEARLAELAKQIEHVRQTKLESAEQLATMLEPLAQAMAALTDETRQTLNEIVQQSREQGEKFQGQIAAAAKTWKDAAAQALAVTESLDTAGRRMELSHYCLALATSVLTAIVVSAFWFWVAPPRVINQLDPQAVADFLRPAIVAAKRWNGR